MNTDPIADLLTRMRNAIRAKHEVVIMPHSKVKMSILNVLKENGYIVGYKEEKDGNFKNISITLNSDIKDLTLKRVSKPGQRIYIKNTEIRPVLNGYVIGIISTPNGVLSSKEAYKTGVGGELLCEIWQ